jgi:hypothetical protein
MRHETKFERNLLRICGVLLALAVVMMFNTGWRQAAMWADAIVGGLALCVLAYFSSAALRVWRGLHRSTPIPPGVMAARLREVRSREQGVLADRPDGTPWLDYLHRRRLAEMQTSAMGLEGKDARR